MKGNNDIYPDPPPDDFIRETVLRITRKYVQDKKLSYIYAVGFKWKPSKYEASPARIGFFFHDPQRKQHQFPFNEIPRTISLLDLYGTNDPAKVYGITEIKSKFPVIGRFCNPNGTGGGAQQQQYFIQPGERIHGRTTSGQLSLGSIGGVFKVANNVSFRGYTLDSNRFYILSADHVFPDNTWEAFQPKTNSPGVEKIGNIVIRDPSDDFALVEVLPNMRTRVKANIKSLGPPKVPAPNMLITGQPVKKSGVSGVTIGTVDYIHVLALSSNPNLVNSHLFTILPNPAFATDGDSGSIVVREMTENGNIVYYPVGMLYKMSASNSYQSIIDKVPGNVYYFARNFLDITNLTQAAVVQSDPI